MEVEESWADAWQYPLHLLNLSSVEDLESKILKDDDIAEVDARRFRANIIGKLSS